MKTNVLKHYLFCVFMTLQVSIFAQTGSTESGSGKRGFGAALSLTSNGIGIEGSMAIAKKDNMFLRANFLYLPISKSGYEFEMNKSKLTADIKGTLGGTGVYFDYHPFKNFFKVTGGAAYLFTTFGGVAKLKDAVKQGEIEIPAEQVGLINVDINPNHVSPYLAVGFGRAIPKKKFGFNCEIGTYYWGAPKVSFVATGMLTPSSNNQPIIEKNMDGYRWLPQLSLNVTYRITN